jgi:hypothetical protein
MYSKFKNLIRRPSLREDGGRPDFSEYLVHFTSSRELTGKRDDNPAKQKVSLSAQDRLISILNERKIIASTMPWTGAHAVCFTECPWSSLLKHTDNYSPYGIGFRKNFIFTKDGGPVYYVRGDQYDKQQWHDDLKVFTTPLWPAQYRSPEVLGNKFCDYSHEREWRVPSDLSFEYNQIQFIILNTYEDMASFPKNLKDTIGRDKFILMENYKTIEKIWPVHKI